MGKQNLTQSANLRVALFSEPRDLGGATKAASAIQISARENAGAL